LWPGRYLGVLCVVHGAGCLTAGCLTAWPPYAVANLAMLLFFLVKLSSAFCLGLLARDKAVKPFLVYAIMLFQVEPENHGKWNNSASIYN